MIEKLELEGYEGDGRNPLMDRDIEDKINELVDLANKLPVMIQGHRWQEDKPTEQTELPWQGLAREQGKLLEKYREALERIIKECDYADNENYIQSIAKTALDSKSEIALEGGE